MNLPRVHKKKTVATARSLHAKKKRVEEFRRKRGRKRGKKNHKLFFLYNQITIIMVNLLPNYLDYGQIPKNNKQTQNHKQKHPHWVKVSSIL